ncbi:MAG: glycosyltransferase [Patescibacteria group bacterium]
MINKTKQPIIFLSYGDLLTESGYKTRIFGEIKLASQLKKYRLYLFSFEKPSNFFANQSRLAALKLELKKYNVSLYIWPRSFWYFPNLWQIFSTLKKIKFKHGIIHAESVYATIIALVIKFFVKTKVIFDAHGLIGPEVQSQKLGFIKNLYAPRLENYCLQHSDYIVTASVSLQQYFLNRKIPVNKISALPCLTDISRQKLLNSQEKAAYRRRLGLPAHKIIGVYLGGGQNWQPLSPVVDFISQTDIFLLVISSEPEKILPQLQTLKNHQYTLVNLPHDQVSSYLLAADLAFLFRNPNLLNRIAFPTKFGEYLVAGLPIVHNGQIDDVTKIIEENNLGWQLPLNFSRSQTAAIVRGFKKQSAAYQARCRDYAKINLLWENYQTTLGSIYQKLSQPKILYIVTSDFYGGAQKYVLDLASYFQSQKCLVDVAFGLGQSNSLFTKKLTSAKLNYFSLWYLQRSINPPLDVLAIFLLRYLFVSRDYDIIHLNSSMVGFIGRLAGIGLEKKIFYTAHGWVFNEKLPWPFRWLYFQLERLTVPLSQKIFCLSQHDYLQTKTLKLGPSQKFRLLPNSINLEQLEILRQQSPLPSDSQHIKTITKWQQKKFKIIGTVANFFPAKNLEQLIPISLKLGQLQRQQIRFIIIGDGPLKKRFQKKLIAHNLEHIFLLTGQLANPFPFLKYFDVFVLPSQKEGFPFAILEAGASNTPIVASPISGVTDLIQSENTGLLADPSDAAQFAAQISLLLNNHVLSKSLANNLFQEIQTKYNQKNILTKYYREYFSN